MASIPTQFEQNEGFEQYGVTFQQKYNWTSAFCERLCVLNRITSQEIIRNAKTP